jgi:hypothetical protein
MNLPFWPFSKIKRLQDELVDYEGSYLGVYEDYANARRDLAAAKEKLVEQDAAFIVAHAVEVLTKAIGGEIMDSTDRLEVALRGVQHAVGAVATAQDKASNVQREWLEVSRGNR